MDFVPLIDQLGERGAAIAGGALIGALFGVFAQRSAFCTRSAVLDLTRGRDLKALAVWAAGFAAAVLGVQYLLASGRLDVLETRFFSTAQSLSGALIGGALFGVGMVLARGCVSRLIVLSASGNLRALYTSVVIAVVGLATYSGVLVPARDLPLWTGLVVLAIFIPLSHLGSRLFHFALDHPPTSNYPRIIRAPTRLREFRACHVPSSRWHHLFNFENYFFYRVVIDRFFRVIGRYRQGVENVLAVAISEQIFVFDDLPEEFDGFRILLLTDLHLDGLEPLTDVLIERVRDLEVAICLIGGDIRMELYGPIAPSVRLLRKLVDSVQAKHGKFGVLGNHDCIEMLPDLEDAGVSMLINEAREIVRNRASLWLIGVDDPHFYKCDDLEYACSDVPPEAFKILLAHSPEIYHKATDPGIRLYLCGHTHGGQICLPWVGPVFTHSSAPRYTAAGHWTFGDMTGYTSRGAGASGVPLRFNCPGEIPLITLRNRMPQPTV